MKLSKSEWLKACHFHDLSEKQVLEEVATRAKKALEKSEAPVVLLDLDSTLYEVAPRSHQIVKEWLLTSESARFPHVKKALSLLEGHQVGYSLKDTFNTLGLSFDQTEVHEAWQSVKNFWGERFFSHDYLKYDHAYPGAAEFTRKIYELGTQIVYLTGRDEPGMGDGTRRKLIEDGFPFHVPRTSLLMKAHPTLPDLEHKLEAAEFVRKQGRLIASFENEPANLSALYRACPDAMHVFVDTVSSDHQAWVCEGLYRIKGFGV